MVKKISEGDSVVSAASALGKRRWAGMTAEERREVMLYAVERSAKLRKLQPKSVRKARAAKAAKSISPEAAKARAMKAWETRRKKAELERAG